MGISTNYVITSRLPSLSFFFASLPFFLQIHSKTILSEFQSEFVTKMEGLLCPLFYIFFIISTFPGVSFPISFISIPGLIAYVFKLSKVFYYLHERKKERKKEFYWNYMTMETLLGTITRM